MRQPPIGTEASYGMIMTLLTSVGSVTSWDRRPGYEALIDALAAMHPEGLSMRDRDPKHTRYDYLAEMVDVHGVPVEEIIAVCMLALGPSPRAVPEKQSS